MVSPLQYQIMHPSVLLHIGNQSVPHKLSEPILLMRTERTDHPINIYLEVPIPPRFAVDMNKISLFPQCPIPLPSPRLRPVRRLLPFTRLLH